jgi:xanthine/uracil/vitamin C permease (AzgA family)
VVMKLIPRSVKLATIVGMGLQIALVGMTSVKLVVPNEQTIVGLGDIHSPQIWLSIFGLVLIGSLLFHQVRGGILIGIFAMTVIDWIMKGHVPHQVMQFPDLRINMSDFIQLEHFNPGRCLTGILAFLFIGVIDVSGVIFGMASLANLTDSDGHIPGATPTFVAVALSTIVSAATGGTPVIVYVESAAGIKEGGRTGLTAVFISAYFLLSLFFAPVLSEIPLIATAPVAILVGAMMMSQAVEIDWNNMSEAIPAFLTLVTMPFTFSITNGIVLGLITAFMFYVTTGQIFVDAKSVMYGPSAASANALELQRLHPGTASDTQAYSSIPHLHDHDHHTHLPTISENVPILVTRSHSGSLQNAGSHESHSFIDDQPFMRHPSLILRKRDVDAAQAQGRAHSHSRDEGGGGTPTGRKESRSGSFFA